ncbi:hypothetical protein SAMN05421869_109196 [Nonomuraea jiangxiensis]|uniref:Uncharacterized protein n=1 Tax=Nonomuraea jiangxiensis TaxID=633440 RepID=A0A1G8RWY7_9ACTN|nr:hypothetical protein SAMN05421869_109196 [Nonomuraea jiangxiensis]
MRRNVCLIATKRKPYGQGVYEKHVTLWISYPPGVSSEFIRTLNKITVVGASLAGLRAVQALRREGFDRDITLVGAETHTPTTGRRCRRAC